jgi:hypothetical protein
MTYLTLRNRDVAERGLFAFVVFVLLVGVTGLVVNYRLALSSSSQDAAVSRTSSNS